LANLRNSGVLVPGQVALITGMEIFFWEPAVVLLSTLLVSLPCTP